MQKILTGLALGTALVVGLQANANAQMRTSKPASGKIYGTMPAAENNTLGIGYKLGNGIGFTGADLIINPTPNVSLDLQGAMTEGTFAFAPAIQFHMDPAGGPYVGVGYQHVIGTTSVAAAQGAFANVGWQFRPMTNVGVLVGVGYQQLFNPSSAGGLNYEAGVRYFFM